MRHKDAEEEEEEEDRELVLNDASGIAGNSVQYTKWEVELSSDGFLHLQTQSNHDS